jgi:hypothetical protein
MMRYRQRTGEAAGRQVNEKQGSEPLSSVKKKMQKRVGKGKRKIIGKTGEEE